MLWTVVLEKTPESPLDCKEIQPVCAKGNQSWIFIGRTNVETKTPILGTWCEELTHLPRSCCWERLKVEGEGANRGCYGWMASPAQWAWVWVDSGRWWWTGRPGVLQTVHGVAQRQTWLSDWTELRSIHVAAHSTISFFLWLSYLSLYMYATSSLSIYLLMDMDLFHVFSLVQFSSVQ